jgi:hypothetical protein
LWVFFLNCFGWRRWLSLRIEISLMIWSKIDLIDILILIDLINLLDIIISLIDRRLSLILFRFYIGSALWFFESFQEQLNIISQIVQIKSLNHNILPTLLQFLKLIFFFLFNLFFNTLSRYIFMHLLVWLSTFPSCFTFLFKYLQLPIILYIITLLVLI